MTAGREIRGDGVRRLTVAAGTGLLVSRGWSWEVREVAGDLSGWLDAAEQWAALEAVLDLRSAGPAPGFVPLGDAGDLTDSGDPHAEHVRPVPVRLSDLEATRALGARLAPALRAGDLLVLSGPLGAGKTSLVQGLAAGLGVRGRVTSPTFVLARTHPGPLPLVHVDAYRLRDGGAAALDLDHLDDLDLDTALTDAVTVVEWGEGLVEALADARLSVLLHRPPGTGADDPDADSRTVHVRPHGARWAVLAQDDAATRTPRHSLSPGPAL